MSLLRQTSGHCMRYAGRPLPPSARCGRSRHNVHSPAVLASLARCIATTSSTRINTAGSASLATKQQLTGRYVSSALMDRVTSLSKSVDDYIDNLMTIPTVLFAKYPPSMQFIDDDDDDAEL
ncbi:hypothetical protein SDRG_07735 [Saprolegnia diclina VS20]|uniref:Uncharacterized protein n=1 Tax=Saprolegnia diclina (strain VS20) TaxID=1156394 RepID=T0RX16_SAPDV|nr:hypothetical protein SDRG_07735 [Saprolegnia diclina VS20]EQC34937.1 hypothetical protein SDRG_07735 [Saprolegnia diclina VS20]|eukprot:XP_008611809.1 hypothetical protein SDRG_07735 [Saprolegnia diclina VS20]